jgi:hypothetical protein
MIQYNIYISLSLQGIYIFICYPLFVCPSLFLSINLSVNFVSENILDISFLYSSIYLSIYLTILSYYLFMCMFPSTYFIYLPLRIII